MKKQFKLLGALLLVFLMASCGGKSENTNDSVTLTVEPQLGELGNYITISDSEVIIKVSEESDGEKYLVSSLSVTVNQGVAADNDYDFNGVVYDENHVELEEFNYMYKLDSDTDFDIEKCHDVLRAGTYRAQFKVQLSDANKDKWEKILKEGKYLAIKPSWENTEYKALGTSVAETNESGVADAEPESSFGSENIILPSQLKGNVEVVSASKSVSSLGYPEVNVTFKLLKKVNTKPLLSQYGQMWIVGVGQDEKGVDVKGLLPSYREWRSDDSDGNEFKEFLEGDPDDTITMRFSGSKENSSDVSAELAQVEKFKLKLTK